MERPTTYWLKRSIVCAIQICVMKSKLISALQQRRCINGQSFKPEDLALTTSTLLPIRASECGSRQYAELWASSVGSMHRAWNPE